MISVSLDCRRKQELLLVFSLKRQSPELGREPEKQTHHNLCSTVGAVEAECDRVVLLVHLAYAGRVVEV